MAGWTWYRSTATLHIAQASCSKQAGCECHGVPFLRPARSRAPLLRSSCHGLSHCKQGHTSRRSSSFQDFKQRHRCRRRVQSSKDPQDPQLTDSAQEAVRGNDEYQDAEAGSSYQQGPAETSSGHSNGSNGTKPAEAKYVDEVIETDATESGSEEGRHYSVRRPYPGQSRQVNVADFDDPAEAVDALWSMLPIDQMRRPGELGWDMSPEGPVGPERLDNVFNNVQQTSNAEAINKIGMGTWRLKGCASQLIVDLVKNVEGGWRHFIDDLGLYGLERKWLYLDSLDPKQEYGQWSYKDLENPKSRQDPKWPRLQIENRCYQSEAFRKLHMEVAHRQDGLEIFHCVMYPRLEYNLPILSIDVVAKDEVVSLGIIDPCPVAMDQSLPPAYTQIASELQEIYGVQSNREIPEWGQQIFSDQVVIMRPEDAEEFDAFFSYLIAMVRVHLRLANATDPTAEADNLEEHLLQTRQANIRYCEQQLRNKKTTRVLAAAFSEDFAEQYMQEVMFDMSEVTAPTPNAENGSIA